MPDYAFIFRTQFNHGRYATEFLESFLKPGKYNIHCINLFGNSVFVRASDYPPQRFECLEIWQDLYQAGNYSSETIFFMKPGF